MQQIRWPAFRGTQLGGCTADASANQNAHPSETVPQLQSAVAEAVGEGWMRFAGRVHLLGELCKDTKCICFFFFVSCIRLHFSRGGTETRHTHTHIYIETRHGITNGMLLAKGLSGPLHFLLQFVLFCSSVELYSIWLSSSASTSTCTLLWTEMAKTKGQLAGLGLKNFL